MQRDLLVLTDQSIRANQKASLTYRLVLPSQVTYDFPLPTMHDFRIWWAERFSGKVYLKACLDGCRMYARHTRAGERQSLAVGSIDTSAYIYRDRPTCILEGIIDTSANAKGWQTIELNQHQASRLVRQKTEASPIVLSLDDAVRINRRVLHNCWPQRESGVLHPHGLWKTFKRTATLSELVRLNGLDPYETSVVAALTDIGVAFSVKDILQHIYTNGNLSQLRPYHRDSTRTRGPAFIPLGSLDCEAALAQPVARPSQFKVGNLSLEHEAILAALAHRLASMRIMPYLSPLVDLAVIHDRSALFFEVKTVSHKNLLDQVRAAIGQLLEYRFVYRESFDSINLALVASPLGSPSELSFAKDFVKYCGIDWVFWFPSGARLELLEETVRRFYYAHGDTVEAYGELSSQQGDRRVLHRQEFMELKRQ